MYESSFLQPLKDIRNDIIVAKEEKEEELKLSVLKKEGISTIPEALIATKVKGITPQSSSASNNNSAAAAADTTATSWFGFSSASSVTDTATTATSQSQSISVNRVGSDSNMITCAGIPSIGCCSG